MAPGAIHDSNERCDAPKCMEETRVAVQEEIMSWIADGQNDAQPKNIMWVTGPAGTGKSAILGSIADACKEKGTLAASFFFSAFSGSADRRTKRYLIPTLTYQLMSDAAFPGIREQILSSVMQDPILFTKNLKEQFTTMVLNPLLSRTQEPGGNSEAALRVIIIDGLDECDVEQFQDSAGRTHPSAHVLPIRRKEDDQREILSLLLLAASNPSFPFRILVASRPEKVIRNVFTTDGKAYTRELFLDDSYDPDADIGLFYDAKFSIICRDLGIKPEDWPGKEAKLTLVRDASGQFIYAATVMRYIEGSSHSIRPGAGILGRASPPERLEHILGLHSKRGDKMSLNPLKPLDALYSLLLESCPDPELSMKWLRATQQKVISALRKDTAPVRLLRLVLEASHGEEQYALGSLSSLLPTQIFGESLLKPYSFYHKSFLDFIADPVRCGERFMTDAQVRDWMAQRFFQTLDRHFTDVELSEIWEIGYQDFPRWIRFSTQAAFEIAKPDILSCDLQKWATTVAEAHLKGLDCKYAIVYVLDMLHDKVCSQYRCCSTCKTSAERVMGVLREKSWKVPSWIQVSRRDWWRKRRYQDLKPPRRHLNMELP
ncbi:hypothetical protein DFP72DRAFT_3069 [Ephemerocybe angulata]|uniref:NACHT domain-containing protein n=1 Tax=Ephemerocybe angulata TaxID=980116 RepID=A0A8H6II06_9AGAR|nr:hypothetical protein DFP72DRAFT_3069 [Tulosesus angulatus]